LRLGIISKVEDNIYCSALNYKDNERQIAVEVLNLATIRGYIYGI